VERAERRRREQAARSPIEILKTIPALVVLRRIPVPTLAISVDGSILVANSAVAEMLGYSVDELLSLSFHDIFRGPLVGSAVETVREHADRMVDLAHSDGSTVRAKMSGSALLRGSDPVALVAFQDLTEELWTDAP
jgi:PAS domain S-box-containing protein